MGENNQETPDISPELIEETITGNAPPQVEIPKETIQEPPPQTADDRLNAMMLAELNELGGQRIFTVFFETGQVSSFVTNLPRETIKSKLGGGRSFLAIPELKQAQGFTDGEVFINLDKILFSILREKSNLILPPQSRIQLAR